MIYRELTPKELEAYNVGYKNGSRQAVIKVLEFESAEEKKLYRQGYNAGCQDRKRHNVNTYEIVSNVSSVSNVDSYDSTITNTIVDTNSGDRGISNKGVIGGKEKKGEGVSKEQIIDGWNAVAKCFGLAGIKSVDDTRMSKFKQRFKQSGKKTVEEFFDLLKQILDDSLFLQGKKQVRDGAEWIFQDADWSATFDFFMQQKSFTKAIEGGYDDPTIRRLKEKRKDDATKNSDMPVPSEVSTGYTA